MTQLTRDIPFNSDLHRRILARVASRMKIAEAEQSKHHNRWKDAEERVLAYLPESEADGRRRRRREQKGEPQYTTIQLPYTFAVLMTFHTYVTSVFFGRNPVHQFSGRHGEGEMQVQAMEALIAYQLDVGQMLAPYYLWLYDGGKYGVGWLGTFWDQEIIQYGTIEEVTDPVTGETQKVQSSNRIRGYTGHRAYNISPYDAFPDPRVTVGNFQRGEFFGVRQRIGWDVLQQRKARGFYTNTEHITSNRGNVSSEMGSAQVERPRSDWTLQSDDKNSHPAFLEVREVYVKVVQKEWGLGEADWSEIWVFTVTEDMAVILGAQPLGCAHGKFPIDVVEPEVEAYGVYNRSFPEILQPIQQTMDWLINCYDDQTELLTDRGFVPFPQVHPQDRVATVAPDLTQLWFERPEAVWHLPWSGPMVHFESKQLDLCVTPNHQMFVANRSTPNNFSFRAAETLTTGEWHIPVTLTAPDEASTPQPPIIFEAQLPKRKRGAKIRYREIVCEWEFLAPFIGLYVSEGSATHGAASGSYNVRLVQKKEIGIKIIDMVMARCPFHVTRTVRTNGAVDWCVTDKRFYEWLVLHCGRRSSGKRLPRELFALPVALRRAVFDTAMLGDGFWYRDNLGVYGSNSPQLLNDLQELALTLGIHTTVVANRLRVNTEREVVSIAPHMVSVAPYDRLVHCITNSTHLTVVRRNGKVAICGQTHFYNVRASLNNQFIIDPTKIVMKDVEKGGPGFVFRMRPEAFGQDIDKMFKQVNVNDVTQLHMNDLNSMFGIGERIFGINDQMLGMLSAGGRKTATEVRTATGFGVNRLKTISEYISATAFAPHAQKLVMNSQQYYDLNLKLKIVGDLALMSGQKFLQVTPEEIVGSFDFVPVDGTLPVDRFAQVTMWKDLLGQIAQVPQVMMQYDLGKIFAWVAQLAGIKNINQFKIQVQPDAALAQQAQAGNVIPLPIGQSGRDAGAGTVTRPPQPPMIPSSAGADNGAY